MKKLIYILLFLVVGFANAQRTGGETLLVSQKQFANEGSLNLIINGVFDNSNNLTLDAGWTIGGGLAIYDGTAEDWVTFDITTDLLDGSSYTLNLDFLNGTGTSRIRLFARYGGGDQQITSNTTYADGNQTINFTLSIGGDGTDLSIVTSSIASAFDIDNVVLTKD